MALSGPVEWYWPELMSEKVLAISLPALRGGGLGRQKCQFVKCLLLVILP